MALSPGQYGAVTTTERATSVLSMLATFLVIGVFLTRSGSRKPMNRLIFMASFGNILSNVATLIGTSAIPEDPATYSPLCEIQGFMIQCFMLADSLWILSIAVNVHLVFSRGYDAQKLRSREKIYLMINYGVPSAIALSYVIADHVTSRNIIGPATLWCWVSTEVEWLRIVLFYAPIWVAMITTISIYIKTGKKIFIGRVNIRSISRTHVSQGGVRPVNRVKAARTTNKVATVASGTNNSVRTNPSTSNTPAAASNTNAPILKTPTAKKVTVETDTKAETHDTSKSQSQTSQKKVSFADLPNTKNQAQNKEGEGKKSHKATANSSCRANNGRRRRRRLNKFERILLWIYHILDEKTLAYLKISFLMCFALCITWIPSTINHCLQLANKDGYGWNFAAATVLPLQGLWNAIIFAATAWSECMQAGLDAQKIIFQSNAVTKRLQSHSQDSLTGLLASRDSDIELSVIRTDKKDAAIKVTLPEMPRRPPPVARLNVRRVR